MKNKFELQPGNELRGMIIRLYPTKEQEELLEILMNDSRKAWNWLVSQTEQVLKAREAHAIREKLVPARPIVPVYEGLLPEEASNAKTKFLNDLREWYSLVHAATDKLSCCKYRSFKDLLNHFQFKHDYQLLDRVISWTYDEGAERKIKPCAHLLQALTKNYFTKATGMRRKKFRKQKDSMPLQVRSGDCFKLGLFGTRRGNPFYNYQISFNSLKIKGRLPGVAPSGRILEGVSIRKEADGWYASIKQEVPKRIPKEGITGSVVGIDVGLDNLVAIASTKDNPLPQEIINDFKKAEEQQGISIKKHNDGWVIPNTRGKIYSERIAGRQILKKEVGRLHQKSARHIKHLIYNGILKPLEQVETIKFENINSKLGQMGSSKTSAMRLVYQIVKERLGESRVLEVDCRFTSQDCSQCGERSKETWSYEHGRIGKCPSCGYSADRDLNAARNVASKPTISLT